VALKVLCPSHYRLAGGEREGGGVVLGGGGGGRNDDLSPKLQAQFGHRKTRVPFRVYRVQSKGVPTLH
jgi:hypothetical protein